ncbi:MAG: peptidase T [Candidatus Thorarchaeota archaeon]
MIISEQVKSILLEKALSNFLRYVKIWTTSENDSTTFPSSMNQTELAKLLREELKELGLENIIQDNYGYVYAKLPASEGLELVSPIGFIAHLDTAPAVTGKNVVPIMHKKYDGSVIKFPKNGDLTLSVADSPELENYLGMDIITSEGNTLLGADDKAGIAEIMAACAAWKIFPDLKHGPIIICFTPDEEVNKGTANIDCNKLPKICYTIDGGVIGELEFECFDAWKANLKFKGINVHPGYAKNLMINAIHIASRFLTDIPESESPEHTEEREGFFHLGTLEGDTEQAEANMIIRDFEKVNNERRMNYLKALKDLYELKYPGLKIELNFEHQYLNMYQYIKNDLKIVDLAKKAIELANIEVIIHPIRGGTDGSKLSEMGILTPNIFTGGHLFHSRKEYIPTVALQKASEVIINLAYLWTNT